MTDIGKHIRSLRIQQGLTQEQLAQMLYVTRQTISNYEMGKSRPDVEMILKIAQALNTDANTVLYGPPDFHRHKSDRTRLIIGMLCCFGLYILYIGLKPWAGELAKKSYVMQPYLLLHLILLPCIWLVMGWTIMQGAYHLLRLDLEKIQLKHISKLRVVLLVVLVGIAVLLVPYAIWLVVVWIRASHGITTGASFPVIPVYTQAVNWFVLQWIHHSYFAVVLGGAFWWGVSSLHLHND